MKLEWKFSDMQDLKFLLFYILLRSFLDMYYTKQGNKPRRIKEYEPGSNVSKVKELCEEFLG